MIKAEKNRPKFPKGCYCRGMPYGNKELHLVTSASFVHARCLCQVPRDRIEKRMLFSYPVPTAIVLLFRESTAGWWKKRNGEDHWCGI